MDQGEDRSNWEAERGRGRRATRLVLGLAAAAMLIAALRMALPLVDLYRFGLRPPAEGEWAVPTRVGVIEVVETAPGDRDRVTLTDGTSLVLSPIDRVSGGPREGSLLIVAEATDDRWVHIAIRGRGGYLAEGIDLGDRVVIVSWFLNHEIRWISLPKAEGYPESQLDRLIQPQGGFLLNERAEVVRER